MACKNKTCISALIEKKRKTPIKIENKKTHSNKHYHLMEKVCLQFLNQIHPNISPTLTMLRVCRFSRHFLTLFPGFDLRTGLSVFETYLFCLFFEAIILRINF